MVRGYKAYKKGLVNQFGEKYEVGKTYSTSGVEYEKQGFYFCPYLEDTLRYYDGLKEEIDIALVEGFGEVQEFFDEYYETTSIAATNLKILKVLSRKEIINYALGLNDLKLRKFIAGYHMTEEEISLFQNRENVIKKYIAFYQYGDKEAFAKEPHARRIK